MSKTILYVVLAILIIGGGVWWAISMNKPATDTTTDTTTLSTDDAESLDATSPSPEASSSPISSATTPSSTADSSTVTITNSGYSPSTLTVKAGTTVTFKNESGAGVWIASDPHPTHTDLPGFDAKKAIANGSSYSFTFSKTGSWGYHDHLNSSEVGTIIVQ